ncbi:MAG: FtsK/SpoIIIE domain-containing protein, partial [Chthoniobacteraceae bacterium]
EYDRTMADVQRLWDQGGESGEDFEARARRKTERQLPRAFAKNESLLRPRLARAQEEYDATLAREKAAAELAQTKLQERHASEIAEIDTDESNRWAELIADWKRHAHPLLAEIDDMNVALAGEFPPWTPKFVENWTPPAAYLPATKFGKLELDFREDGQAMPQDPRLALPYGPNLSVPLALTYPDQGSLLFETKESADGTLVDVLNGIILRLLTTTPPGKLALTILDPVPLGQSFAGLMHLADYEEGLINRRIWTQREQIEDRLAELGEHAEKVIQMYLRTDFATITEYNEKAGSVAEKYHFLVVADFPAGFTESSAKRLQSIVASGARCGIYTLIHWDQRQTLPEGIDPDEMRRNAVAFRQSGDHFTLGKTQEESGAHLKFDPPPEAGLAVELIHKIGKSSVDSNRVEVPFSQIAPERPEMWTGSTTDELRIAIGRTGATKHQMLAIGKGTRQHALFAGKTGSGKSTLFHVIITNLALTCSPEEVEFYLIDFKKGVEFKCYAEKRLPHAKVVAIESDREFGLSVLERVDEELKRRGDMFRALGVQDIPGYKRAGGTEPIPRCLLIIDEFQEFFVEDDTIAQNASVLFDRIVRQGRAFGIHVLLGSQTLGGAYSLARATLGQMVIRVALQCNEADAYLIMDDNNAAPRLLSRPGEGIYNDAAGAIEGNSPFQVVWLPDDERDAWLDTVREVAKEHGDRHPGPIVFEGNSPADIRENELLAKTLSTVPGQRPNAPRAWLGAPNSIKGPTQVGFQRQSGNHLLFVGQREDSTLTLLALSLLALAAQHPAGTAKFIFLHGLTDDSADAQFLDQMARLARHDVRISTGADLPELMAELAADMKERLADSSHAAAAPNVFLIVHGLQKFKKLRREDDFSFSSSESETGNPGDQFNDLITEGSTVGMHMLVSIDTFNNVNRCMSRKALTEFEMRVIFQMSANDSASLIDSPKASGLGLHRALLYNEQHGSLETFRPYSRPDDVWMRDAEESLSTTGIAGPVTPVD